MNNFLKNKELLQHISQLKNFNGLNVLNLTTLLNALYVKANGGKNYSYKTE